ESFVCIKVDREERPDLDEIYMSATVALNRGQGGWPMTVFLAPDQQPFFAGTYFPPTDRYGRPGFATLLRQIAELWRSNPDGLRTQATQLTDRLRQQSGPLPSMAVGEAELAAAAAHFAESFDPTHGGFGPAPKFPAATGLSLLLRQHRRTGDAQALHMVRTTLDAMARGGIYDQIGGGFARYSTDEHWLVPHFEKMLYDNSLLTRTYLEAFQVTGDPFYRQIATEVLDYILREMTAPEGGFYSATDADSEGEEGKFFVWTPAEIEAILGEEEARRFCAYYDITESGNWEGNSIANVRRTVDQVAAKLAIPAQELQTSLDRARPKVYEARRRRVPPGLDDKILTAWNGMMIG
ncbi:MAG: thioredoxin domain-containing protein, partial [candidate division NC10 bacterium]|nr:thioredoxin domain-containing protein [candidate division NC10 bacterium]